MKRDSSNLKSDGVSVELIISDPFCRTIKEALRSVFLGTLRQQHHLYTASRKAKIYYPNKKIVFILRLSGWCPENLAVALGIATFLQ